MFLNSRPQSVQLSVNDSMHAKPEVKTVDTLQGVVKRIFLQIRDQLDEPSHPLIRVIRDFQICFIRDLKDKIRDVSELQGSLDYVK